jgi:RNA polymerase sigma-70 factor, ECF subfamily
MNMDSSIRAAMIPAIPQLRRFAVSLAGAELADDLVEETLLQACRKIRLFDPWSQLLAWLITILRHQFYRERRSETEDVDGIYAETLVTGPSQIAHAEHRDPRASPSHVLTVSAST